MRRCLAPSGPCRFALVALVLAMFAGCGGGGSDETARTSAARPGAAGSDAAPSPARRGIRRIHLGNGITVYLEEEHSNDGVAVEVLYRVGYPDEPAGAAQIAHLAEHAHVHGATSAGGADSLFQAIREFGQASAQVAGPVTHIDYFVPADHVEDVLRAEALRLESLRVDPEMLRTEAAHAQDEIQKFLAGSGGSMHVYGESAFQQVVRHGARSVDIVEALGRIDARRVADFHRTHYVPRNMVVAIAGAFDTDAVAAMIRDILGSIPERDPAAVPPVRIDGDVHATWDLPVRAVYLVWPEAVPSYADRLALTIYASYVRHQIIADTDLAALVDRVYSSNPAAPVGAEPFFVYAQPTPTASLDDVVGAVDRIVRQTREGIDANRFASIRANARRFVETTLIDKAATLAVRQRYLGQEALNTGLKHFYMEGMEPEDFLATIDALSYDDFLRCLDRYLEPSDRHVVVFTPRTTR